MRTRHLAVGLGLAAVALVLLTVILSPPVGAGSAPLTTAPTAAGTSPSASHRPHRNGPVGPTASPVTPSAPGSAPSTAKPSASTSPAGKPSAGSSTPGSTRQSGANTPKVVVPKKPVKPGSKGVVYLTFDDGPGPYTPAVLKILRDTNSTATFFQMGIRVVQNPALAGQVRSAGNAIGNHTYDHADLTKLTPAKRRAELNMGPRARCVRPPYGATNAAVRASIRAYGGRQVLWTVDTQDWAKPGAGRIAQRASGPNVHNGSIVLMHDGGGDRSETVQALPVIIKNLQLRGYVIRKLPYC